MSARERLRQLIDRDQDRLRAAVPPEGEAVVIALLRARGRGAVKSGTDPSPDLITGRRRADLGGNLALRLCLEAIGGGSHVSGGRDRVLDRWAVQFLAESARLVEAEFVLGHCETGFMQIVDAEGGALDAWITTRLMPASWREREDIDWWARWLAERRVADARAGTRDPELRFRGMAESRLAAMEYQLGLPTDATIEDCSVGTWRDVLRCLIERALQERDRGEEILVRGERELTAEIAAELSIDLDTATTALSALTVDHDNVAWHAAVPAVAAAPIVRVGPDRLALSAHGLTSEPLFFLSRELRRRSAEAYHNAAHLREGTFRDDLYALFRDKRFVTSAGRIKLRRDEGGIRTDIDAAVFDRKTGTLGVFELKSQDPFARSTEELIRQRDNLLHANRQVSGVLAWLNRHGGDEILRRFDARTARTFRVQKVYPFVLGRYLAHFSGGPEPNRRAAWGTWPQVLRLLDEQPGRASRSNPIATLHTMLAKDTPLARDPAGEPREVTFGETRIHVYPSYGAYRDRSSEARQG